MVEKCRTKQSTFIYVFFKRKIPLILQIAYSVVWKTEDSLNKRNSVKDSSGKYRIKF